MERWPLSCTWHRAGALLAFCVAVYGDAYAGEVLQVLQERAVGFDRAYVERAMEEAAVRATDPAGRLLAADEELTSAEGGGRGAAGPGVDARSGWEDWRVLTTGIVLVTVGHLEEDTAGAVAVLSGVVTSATDGLVLDLRQAAGNGWSAVPVLAGLLGCQPENQLFWAEDARGERRGFSSQPARVEPMDRLPLAVLTDEQTAGAAELLAGILKIDGRAVLIGEVTAGDPWWRETIPLSDGRRLYVATRRLILADGESYESGIPPDVPGRRRGAVTGRPVVSGVGGAMTNAWQEDVWLRQAVDILTAVRALNRPRAAGENP